MRLILNMIVIVSAACVMACSGSRDEQEELCSCIKDIDALDKQMREEGSSRELANEFKKRMANCAKVMKDYKPEKKEEILKNCE